jgi:NADH dehydrogenase
MARLIAGVGFGGLAAAKGLAKQPVEVTVIDKRNYHLFQPLLYQVATAAFSPPICPGKRILLAFERAEVAMKTPAQPS